MFEITLGRSEAMFDDNAFPGVPEAVPGSVVTIGPFERVGLTYDFLRVPDGDDFKSIARHKDGLWWLAGDPYPFSDIDIHPTS